jgi:uncharacterized alpha/beta hydrolase family protein
MKLKIKIIITFFVILTIGYCGGNINSNKNSESPPNGNNNNETALTDTEDVSKDTNALDINDFLFKT